MRYLICSTKIEDSKGLDDYIKQYGEHFNEKLCDFAIDLMTTRNMLGIETKLTPWTKDKIDLLLNKHNIKINDNHLLDYVYVCNMGAADYLSRAIPDELHLMLYIKDTIDDVDGEVGTVFCRWLADMKHKNIEIDWENML